MIVNQTIFSINRASSTIHLDLNKPLVNNNFCHWDIQLTVHQVKLCEMHCICTSCICVNHMQAIGS